MRLEFSIHIEDLLHDLCVFFRQERNRERAARIRKSTNAGRELTISFWWGFSDEKIGGCDGRTSYARSVRSWMIAIAKGANNGGEIRSRPNARVVVFCFESDVRRPRIPDARFLTVAGSYLQLSFVFPSSPKARKPSRTFLSRPRHTLGRREWTPKEISDAFK